MRLELFGRFSRATLPSRELGYLEKWVPIAILIGVVSGLGALLFYEVINLFTMIMLGQIAGFSPPAPAGEGALVVSLPTRPLLIPIVTTSGDLLSASCATQPVFSVMFLTMYRSTLGFIPTSLSALNQYL
jgi:hypothetical protein